MAAAFLAARTPALDVWRLIEAAIAAAIFGNMIGFWIGRRFGFRLLAAWSSLVRMTGAFRLRMRGRGSCCIPSRRTRRRMLRR